MVGSIAIIEITKGEQKVIGFIDGLPKDHVCDEKGDLVYQTASGKRVYWNTHKEWAGYTTQARDPLIWDYYYSIDDPILMSSCTCSICKEVAFDQAAWL